MDEGHLEDAVSLSTDHEDVPTMEEYIESTVRSVLLADHFLQELHDRNESLLAL